MASRRGDDARCRSRQLRPRERGERQRIDRHAAAAAAPAPPPNGGTPWGRQRSDETPQTGEVLAKLTAAAKARVGDDATVVRVETDADGHGAYEAHMVKADGTPVTVYFDSSYDVTSVESR